MKSNRKINADEVTRMHCQGVSPERIAASLCADLETIEYILDCEWNRWAAQYGYDN